MRICTDNFDWILRKILSENLKKIYSKIIRTILLRFLALASVASSMRPITPTAQKSKENLRQMKNED